MASKRPNGNGSARDAAGGRQARTGNGKRGGETPGAPATSLGAHAAGNGGRSSPGMIPTPRGSKVPAQDSDFLTTSHGQRLSHTDDSLKAGARGPTLMDDFHLREKIMHF